MCAVKKRQRKKQAAEVLRGLMAHHFSQPEVRRRVLAMALELELRPPSDPRLTPRWLDDLAFQVPANQWDARDTDSPERPKLSIPRLPRA